MQHAIGEHRHEDGIRHAHQADETKEEQQRTNGSGADSKLKPFDDALPRRHRGVVRAARLYLHGGERADDGDVADRVDQEAPALAHRRDHDAGDGGSRDARAVDHRRVQRDRVEQVLAAADHLDHERLPRRDVERVRDAEQRSQDEEMPHLDGAGERDCREDERENHHGGLRADEDAPPIRAIRHDAAERRQQKDRNLARESDQAEKRRGAREPVDQPRLRDGLHPGADEGDELAREEETIIPRLQSGKSGTHQKSLELFSFQLAAIPAAPRSDRHGSRGEQGDSWRRARRRRARRRPTQTSRDRAAGR